MFAQVVGCNTCWSPLFLPSPPEFILVHTLTFPIQPQVINEGMDYALLAEDETKAASCKASSWIWGWKEQILWSSGWWFTPCGTYWEVCWDGAGLGLVASLRRGFLPGIVRCKAPIAAFLAVVSLICSHLMRSLFSWRLYELHIFLSSCLPLKLEWRWCPGQVM